MDNRSLVFTLLQLILFTFILKNYSSLCSLPAVQNNRHNNTPYAPYRRARGGRRKQRKVEVVITRPRVYKTTRGINNNNLLRIKTTDTDCIKKTDNTIIGLINAQSANNKHALIYDLLHEKQCDILFITET